MTVLPEFGQFGDRISYTLTDAEGNPVTASGFVLDGTLLRVADPAGADFETAETILAYLTATTPAGTSEPWLVTLTVTDTAEIILLDDTGVTFTDTGVAEAAIFGGAGDDEITAHDAGGSLHGGDGSDRLIGGTGDDAFTGGAGDDTLDGGAGDDVAHFSGAWADYRIELADGVCTITDLRPGAPDATDTLTGIETLVFSDGPLTITEALNDAPELFAEGGTVAEQVAGAVVGGVAVSDPDLRDSVTLATDDPRFEIVDGQLRLREDAALDYETDGPEVAVTLIATDLHGATATRAVTLTVTDAAEIIRLDDTGVTFTDTGVTEIAIFGGAGDDEITGSSGNDYLIGNAGADTIRGGDGDDFIDDGEREYEGSGDDVFFGGAGNDTLWGGDDSDSLFGDDGQDNLHGQNGNDQISGGSGKDALFGEAGDDTLSGGAGDDWIDGGSGSDTAVWEGELSDFVIRYDAAADIFAITDTASNGDTDEGTDIVTRVESFVFDGVAYSAAEIREEAARQANSAPTRITFATGGSVAETVADGGTVSKPYDPSGTTVATLATSDSDSDDIHVYTLLDDPSGKFEIVGNEVRVKSGQTIDHETDAGFDLTIRTTDRFGEVHDQVMTLKVIDFEGEYVSAEMNVAVQGTSEEDKITGSNGADKIDSGDGNDVIDGGGSLADDALALLNFDGDVSFATDSSENNRDGAFRGDAKIGGTGWNGDGNGLVLDGRGDYVEIPADAAFEMTEGTVSVRFNTDILSGRQTIFSRDSMNFDGGGHLTAWLLSDGSIEVRLQSATDNTYLRSDAGSVIVGEWTHIAVTFGADGAQLFLDGNKVDALAYTGGIAGNSEPWTIGADQGVSGDGTADNLRDFFSGTIDEFAVFDRQLSGNEIKDIETSGIISSGDRLSGGAGDDTLTSGSGADTLMGDDGNDSLDGGGGNDWLDGGHGDDVMHGGAGDDYLDGWTGNDVLRGGEGRDVLLGWEGNDTLIGGDGEDSLYGEQNNDILFGGSGDDWLVGGSGDDTIFGGAGNDKMQGGTGNDLFVFSALEGSDVVKGGSDWVDTIELIDVSGAYTLSGNVLDGEGWTMVLDDNSKFVGKTLDSIELSTDAAGVITFDAGGTIDFSGIERITF